MAFYNAYASGAEFHVGDELSRERNRANVNTSEHFVSDMSPDGGSTNEQDPSLAFVSDAISNAPVTDLKVLNASSNARATDRKALDANTIIPTAKKSRGPVGQRLGEELHGGWKVKENRDEASEWFLWVPLVVLTITFGGMYWMLMRDDGPKLEGV